MTRRASGFLCGKYGWNSAVPIIILRRISTAKKAWLCLSFSCENIKPSLAAWVWTIEIVGFTGKLCKLRWWVWWWEIHVEYNCVCSGERIFLSMPPFINGAVNYGQWMVARLMPEKICCGNNIHWILACHVSIKKISPLKDFTLFLLTKIIFLLLVDFNLTTLTQQHVQELLQKKEWR